MECSTSVYIKLKLKYMPAYAFRGSSEQTYTAVSLANGDAIDAAVGDAAGDSAVGDAAGDSAVGDAPGDSAVGDAPGDSAVRDAAGDAAVGDAAAGDAAVGDAAPLLDWSLDFIEGAVSLLVVVSLNFCFARRFVFWTLV